MVFSDQKKVSLRAASNRRFPRADLRAVAIFIVALLVSASLVRNYQEVWKQLDATFAGTAKRTENQLKLNASSKPDQQLKPDAKKNPQPPILPGAKGSSSKRQDHPNLGENARAESHAFNPSQILPSVNKAAENRTTWIETHLPPPLSRLLPSPRPENIVPHREWRRPAVQNAHIAYHKTTRRYVIAILTAGLLVNAREDTFKVLGCVIGKRSFPGVCHGPKVECKLPSDYSPSVGDIITVIVKDDESLRKALTTNPTSTLAIMVHPGDIYRNQTHVSIHPDIARAELADPKTKSNEVFLVASNTTWQSHLIEELPSDGTRHELCMMTSMKQYPYLLPGWFRYYRRLGVDKFYVYDNNAASDLSVLNSEHVEVVYWPYERSQLQIFTHFLLASRTRCKMAGFFDADEYVMLGDTGPEPLKGYVQRKMERGVEEVLFKSLPMRNSGYLRIPKGELPELYTHQHAFMSKQYKSIINVDLDWRSHKVHRADKADKIAFFNETVELSPTDPDHTAMLVHYTERSWEEYVMKQHVGSASASTRRQPNLELKLQSPKKWYMLEDRSIGWTGMKTYFQKVMKNSEDDGTSVLLWTSGDKVCRQRWCATCDSKADLKDAVCK